MCNPQRDFRLLGYVTGHVEQWREPQTQGQKTWMQGLALTYWQRASPFTLPTLSFLFSQMESLTNFLRLGSALKENIKGFWKAFCKYENFLEIIII